MFAPQEIGGDMEWTIVRPGGLKNDPSSGRGVLTESRDVCGAISREDVADLVVKALFSDSAAGKVPAVLLTSLCLPQCSHASVWQARTGARHCRPCRKPCQAPVSPCCMRGASLPPRAGVLSSVSRQP